MSMAVVKNAISIMIILDNIRCKEIFEVGNICKVREFQNVRFDHVILTDDLAI